MSVLKSLVLLALCASAYAHPPLQGYHEAEGIPAMRRIQAQEQMLQNNRIVMGTAAPKGTHPYMGGLIILLTDGRRSMCGCSMLSNTKVLTAAHCWWDGRTQAFHFTVVYGSDNLTTGGVRTLTNKVEMHASFNPNIYSNDIAMITHARIEYTEYINRIAIPTTNLNHENVWATAVGYGRSSSDPFVPHTMELRQVTLQVIPNSVCKTTYWNLVFTGTLCTDSSRGMSVCSGDSGGPLVIGSSPSRILIGVASFGAAAACESGFPAGFKSTSFFGNWIRNRL